MFSITGSQAVRSSRAEEEAGMTSLNLIYMTRLVDLIALSNFSNKQIFLMFNRKYARLLDSIITQ